MSAASEVDGNGELRLIGGVVGHADDRAKRETGRLFGPVGAVERRMAEGLHRIEIEIFGQNREPEFPNFLETLLFGHVAEVIDDNL